MASLRAACAWRLVRKPPLLSCRRRPVAGSTTPRYHVQVVPRLRVAIVAWGDIDAIKRRVTEHQDAGADHVALQVFDADRHGLPTKQWEALAHALRA